MKFKQLIKIADAAYPDGMIAQAEQAYWKSDKHVGDGLAEFIVEELHETWDPRSGTRNQLAEACRVLSNATREIGVVANAIELTLIGLKK